MWKNKNQNNHIVGTVPKLERKIVEIGGKSIPITHIYMTWLGVRIMIFNGTFNNISVMSWRSVLMVEETRVPGENH